jgi:monovalent cation:H+ antiporter-2, CPA2 family
MLWLPMPHNTALIATIAAALGAAFLLGLIATRFRFPPIVGYLVAGIAVGPFTPGFVASAALSQLAEVGVILLMFGVGLHFSLRDLLAVRRTVIPGALAQTTATTIVGSFVGHAWGWGWGGGVVLGLSLGVASTVVLLKGLEGRDRLDSPEGRLAIGWLVVEDIAMVFALVLLPAVAPMLGASTAAADGNIALSLALALGKVVAFVALMVFVGRRFVPWLLEHVARTGSRELFTLSVLTMALGVGTIAAQVFGISFALGAFFAGAVIGESELSHRAAADALPMQDAFSVLFFVSVGMLFDPKVIVEQWVEVLAIVAIVVAWKSVVAFGLLRLLGQSTRSALLVSAALGQIGEFSFIVGALGVSLGLVTPERQAIIVVAAIVAITLNSPVMSAVVGMIQRLTTRAATAPVEALDDADDFSDFFNHVVLVGHGRVGGTVADALIRAGAKHVVVEEQERVVDGLRARGEPAILGDAARPDVLARAGIGDARLIVITAPEPFRARRIMDVARAANPSITVAVRTHSAAEQAYFEEHLGAKNSTGRAVYSEREAALSLAHYALLALGRSDDEADALVSALRGEATRPTETFKVLATREHQRLPMVTAERPRRVELVNPSGDE